MSDYPKGEIEQKQVALNSIDLISKESGRQIADIVSDDDEISEEDLAIAQRFVQCWNSHDDLLLAHGEIHKVTIEAMDDECTPKEFRMYERIHLIATAAIKKTNKR